MKMQSEFQSTAVLYGTYAGEMKRVANKKNTNY